LRIEVRHDLDHLSAFNHINVCAFRAVAPCRLCRSWILSALTRNGPWALCWWFFTDALSLVRSSLLSDPHRGPSRWRWDWRCDWRLFSRRWCTCRRGVATIVIRCFGVIRFWRRDATSPWNHSWLVFIRVVFFILWFGAVSSRQFSGVGWISPCFSDGF
jgi:hypothetical protein